MLLAQAAHAEYEIYMERGFAKVDEIISSTTNENGSHTITVNNNGKIEKYENVKEIREIKKEEFNTKKFKEDIDNTEKYRWPTHRPLIDDFQEPSWKDNEKFIYEKDGTKKHNPKYIKSFHSDSMKSYYKAKENWKEKYPEEVEEYEKYKNALKFQAITEEQDRIERERIERERKETQELGIDQNIYIFIYQRIDIRYY